MSCTRSSKFYAYLALGIGVLILGFSPLFIRWANAPGTVTAFYRMGIGALLMTYPFIHHVKTREDRLPRQGVLLAVLGGVFFGCDMALWSTGVVMSGATNPTLLSNTAPLWVGLGSLILFHERQNRRFWIGLIVALAGSMIVMGEDLSRASEFGLGSFFGLLAGFFYGAYYLVTQKGRTLLNTITYFYIATTSASTLVFLYNLLMRHTFTGYDARTYGVFLVSGVIVQIGAWIAINYSQGYLPASLVSPTLLGQPVVTAISSALLLDETFTVWHIAGGIAVLTGVFVVYRSRLG